MKERGAIMKMLVAFLILCLVQATAMAEVYEWVDEKGVVNFTDSLQKVPPKYKGVAREKDLSQQKNITIVTEEAPPALPLQQAPTQKTYGGRDARWWGTTIGALRSDITAIEEGLPDKRQELAKLHRRRVLYHKAADRVAANKLGNEIEADEGKLRELQEKLTTLQTQAAEAGVPQELIFR